MWLSQCNRCAVSDRMATERETARLKALEERETARLKALEERAKFADFLYETRLEAQSKRLSERAALMWGAEAREGALHRKHQGLVCRKAMRASHKLSATWGIYRNHVVALQQSRDAVRVESAARLEAWRDEQEARRREVEDLREALRCEEVSVEF